MAIGDNIPKIFGNLAETSMKSSGDFQYHLDLLNNLDADQEMAFRNEANNPFGPPAPMGGPLVDQFLLMSGGDPMAATDMALQESIMENAQDNTELNKNELAAQALYGYSPGSFDPILLDTFANNMGINSSDLQVSYDKVDAITQFNMLDGFATTSGENLIQSIPGSPDDPPPFPRGPIDNEPPPFDPNSSDYNTSLFGEDIGAIKDFFAEDLRETKELPGHIWGGIKKAFGRGYEPYDASADELNRLVPDYQYKTKDEIRNELRETIINEYEPSIQASLEAGDPLIEGNLAQETEALLSAFRTESIEDDEVTEFDMAAIPLEVQQQASGAISTGGQYQDIQDMMLGRSDPEVNLLQGDSSPGRGYSIEFAAQDPSQQWGPYMQQALPNYYAPGVQDAYSRAYQPFLGTYLLSPDIGGFASFMHEYKPEQFPQFEWDAFNPQWGQVLDYAEGQQGSDVATVQGSSRDLAGTNSKLFTALTGSDAPNNAIALAMARYNEGNIVEPSYGNKLLQEALTTMYNLQQREDLYKGDTNTTANFLASLAEINPERFGR